MNVAGKMKYADSCVALDICEQTLTETLCGWQVTSSSSGTNNYQLSVVHANF